MQFKQIGVVILVILLLIILLQNTEVVTFHFLFWQISISRILLLPLAVISGIIIGFLAYPLIIRKAKKEKATE